jgi:hypothetical protein
MIDCRPARIVDCVKWRAPSTQSMRITLCRRTKSVPAISMLGWLSFGIRRNLANYSRTQIVRLTAWKVAFATLLFWCLAPFSTIPRKWI